MKHFLPIVFLLLTGTGFTQPANSSVGLRLGGVSGFSFRYSTEDLKGFEIILGCKENGARVTGLLHKYRALPAGHLTGLYMYTGGGAHAGFIRYDEVVTRKIEGVTYYTHYEKTNPVIGGDFNLGIEYRFESVPMILSMDYKPYFELFGKRTFRVDLWDFGFSIRYSLNG